MCKCGCVYTTRIIVINVKRTLQIRVTMGRRRLRWKYKNHMDMWTRRRRFYIYLLIFWHSWAHGYYCGSWHDDDDDVIFRWRARDHLYIIYMLKYTLTCSYTIYPYILLNYSIIFYCAKSIQYIYIHTKHLRISI